MEEGREGEVSGVSLLSSDYCYVCRLSVSLSLVMYLGVVFR